MISKSLLNEIRRVDKETQKDIAKAICSKVTCHGLSIRGEEGQRDGERRCVPYLGGGCYTIPPTPVQSSARLFLSLVVIQCCQTVTVDIVSVTLFDAARGPVEVANRGLDISL